MAKRARSAHRGAGKPRQRSDGKSRSRRAIAPGAGRARPGAGTSAREDASADNGTGPGTGADSEAGFNALAESVRAVQSGIRKASRTLDRLKANRRALLRRLLGI